MKVRYVGPSQQVKSLTNHQIYSVLFVDSPSHGDKCLLIPKYLQEDGESNDC